MDLFKLFELNYLLDKTPNPGFMYFWPITIFFFLVLLASWQTQKYLSKSPNPKITKRFLGHIPTRMREFAIIGLGLTFFRTESIPWLGMRLWLILFFLLTLIYAVYTWRNYELNFDKALGERAITVKEDKYLPKRKKRKKKSKRK